MTWPFTAATPDPYDWHAPYRSMDASGGPETAGAVAWRWIEEIGKRVQLDCSAPVSINTHGDGSGIQVFTLYQGTALLAAATVFRDDMNFAVLVRWMAEEIV